MRKFKLWMFGIKDILDFKVFAKHTLTFRDRYCPSNPSVSVILKKKQNKTDQSSSSQKGFISAHSSVVHYHGREVKVTGGCLRQLAILCPKLTVRDALPLLSPLFPFKQRRIPAQDRQAFCPQFTPSR